MQCAEEPEQKKRKKSRTINCQACAMLIRRHHQKLHLVLYRLCTLTASRGHSPTSAMNSADADAARKRGVWNLAAVSAPARSA